VPSCTCVEFFSQKEKAKKMNNDPAVRVGGQKTQPGPKFTETIGRKQTFSLKKKKRYIKS
jgi:hypothetical protein